MIIDCPFCGPRELHEYHFRGALPPPDCDAFAAVYARDNRVDYSAEYWQHRHGCQAWLLIERNPSNGEVSSVLLMRGGGR